MNFSQILFIFLCFILIWLVIKFVTKFLYKILLLISIILILIYSFFNFTENNIFDTMQELYCEEESKVDNLKCICFVNNILSDFKIRNNDLSNKELEELKNNTSKSFHEFIKSYNSTKHVIHSCFEENGQSGGMIEEIKNNIIKKARKPLKLFNNK